MDVCQEFSSLEILHEHTIVLRETVCLIQMLDVLLADIILLCTDNSIANEKTLVDNYDTCRRHFYKIRNQIHHKTL